MSSLCRIDMLGGLRVRVGDREITRFQTQKTGALLAYLAAHPNRIHAREAMAELLWPDGEPTAIRNRLNQAVSSLRRQLHPPGIEAGAVLVADHHTLSINQSAVETDVGEFTRALKQSAIAATDEERARHLSTAVGLYQGEFLSGFFEDWALNDRLHLHDQYLEALDKLAKLYSDLGRVDESVDLAARRVAADPQDEAAHLRLMRFLLKAGRPRSAVRQFDELERTLAVEGEMPSEAAYSLLDRAQSVVAASSEADLEDGPAPVSTESRPEQDNHRVRGPSKGPSATRFPRFFTKFVGRTEELSAIRSALSNEDVRLVTLTGMGGCGKTRLAVESGWALEDRFDSRMTFVNLANTTDAAQVLPEVARLVIGQRAAGDDYLGAIVSSIGSQEPTLIVLDNLEQLVEQGIPAISDLLTAMPELVILATSRQPVGMPAERVIQVSPLPVPSSDPSVTLSDLNQSPSVALFVQRAQSVKQDFQLTERTAHAIAELCRRLEGIPLALELAATWARSMSPSQMVEELSKRMDLLASRRKDIAERHRSMRAAIDSSYAMLSQELKDVFLRLSVFEGGWTMDAAETVCPDADVANALQALVERSLVQSVDFEEGVRFQMFELLRAFSRDHLSSDLVKECAWLHAQYFLNHARSFDIYERPYEAGELDRDLQNFEAALDWLRSQGDAESALELVVSLSPYWILRSDAQTARTRIIDALASVPNPPPKLAAAAHAHCAIINQIVGDFEESVRTLAEAAIELESTKQPRLALEVKLYQALNAHRVGDYQTTKKLLSECVEAGLAIGSSRVVTIARRRMGSCSVELREWEDAEREYAMSLKLAREAGLGDDACSSLLNLGHLCLLKRDYDAARRWLSEAAAFGRQCGATDALNDAMATMAMLERRVGAFAEAKRLLLDVMNRNPQHFFIRWETVCETAYLLADIGEHVSSATIFGTLKPVIQSKSFLLKGALGESYHECRSRVIAAIGEPYFQERELMGQSFRFEDVRKTLESTPVP